MKIADFLNSKRRESQSLCDALAEHEATKPEVDAEYNRLDDICAPLARKVSDLSIAGSPRAFEAQAELRRAKMVRDGVRAAYGRKREDLLRQIQALTREPINKFHDRCLQLVKGLSSLYQFSRLETVRNPFNDRVLVRIRHNGAALQAAQDLILRRMREVRGLQDCPLEAVEKRIGECEREFYLIDTSTLEVEEVSESVARTMKPSNPTAELAGDRISNLSGRIAALEGR
jgi:hypothetical protein